MGENEVKTKLSLSFDNLNTKSSSNNALNLLNALKHMG